MKNDYLNNFKIGWLRQLNKTHCPQNHLYAGDNLLYSGGKRYCLECAKNRTKERRHRLGISKKYRKPYTGISYTKEYKKLYRKQWKYRLKKAGKLEIKTIQQVYEDNIKRFGTLTCYLCLKPILFGKDHLEHKTPLVRGGNNERNNLDIACAKCNLSKNNKTVEEYQMKGVDS